MLKSMRDGMVVGLLLVITPLLVLVLLANPSHSADPQIISDELTPWAYMPFVRQDPTPTPTPGPAIIRITHVENNAPGPFPVTREYVVIENQGGTSQVMTNWKLTDQSPRNVYTFPAFTLAPGASVKVWTGCGTNSAEELFWCHVRPVWDDDGDTAYLYNQSDELIDKYTY